MPDSERIEPASTAGMLRSSSWTTTHSPSVFICSVTIDSAFRRERVNEAVGGVPNSAHAAGLAADFTLTA